MELCHQGTFKRYCKTMELRNDAQLIEAYKKAHAKGAAWPEITQGMKEVGIIDMEIYLFGTKLFMIMDTVADFDHDKAMAQLATKPRQSEWEAYMSQFQDTSAEATADQKWQLMERIYKMDF
ncbi:MAG TPA: L-rhamnose mutarotase [Bacteroidales bacterium]|nr:L-rhamnose mutarotase [Bacteroidales bacterium]